MYVRYKFVYLLHVYSFSRRSAQPISLFLTQDTYGDIKRRYIFLILFIKHALLSTEVLHAISNNMYIQCYFLDCSYGYYYCLLLTEHFVGGRRSLDSTNALNSFWHLVMRSGLLVGRVPIFFVRSCLLDLVFPQWNKIWSMGEGYMFRPYIAIIRPYVQVAFKWNLNFTGIKRDASVTLLHTVVSGKCVLLLIGGAHVAGQSRDR
jgi:hypothetical protein